MVLCILSYNILPKVWIETCWMLRESLDERLHAWVMFLIPEKTAHCMLFFAVSSLIWAVITLPNSYYVSCVQEAESKSEKMSIWKWILYIFKKQAVIILWSFLGIYWLAFMLKNHGVESIYQRLFVGNSIISLISGFFLLFIQPFVSQALFASSHLEPGKTKTAIEDLAACLDFPLGGI